MQDWTFSTLSTWHLEGFVIVLPRTPRENQQTTKRQETLVSHQDGQVHGSPHIGSLYSEHSSIKFGMNVFTDSYYLPASI
jgi:hypothetical protein